MVANLVQKKNIYILYDFYSQTHYLNTKNLTKVALLAKPYALGVTRGWAHPKSLPLTMSILNKLFCYKFSTEKEYIYTLYDFYSQTLSKHKKPN